jgi:hypothetical protein
MRDVLLVNGGDPLYLYHWMRNSGLTNLLPPMHETVWVGLSAGSFVMAPNIGQDFAGWTSPNGADETRGSLTSTHDAAIRSHPALWRICAIMLVRSGH